MIRIRRLAYVAFGFVLNTSCAEVYAERPVGAALEFTESCAAGPHCVTGAVTSQRGAPVSGVHCIAEWSEAEPTETVSDRHGLFAMIGLQALPRHFRFEKDGFETQAVSIDTLMRHRRARRDAAADRDAAGSTEVTYSADGSAEMASINTPLIGEDSLSGSQDDEQPEWELDFGSGKTMRLVVTMRRAR